MKLKRMLATALLVLSASPVMADKVYRATKPYWWTVPAMKCDPPNESGDYWCRAGAWQIGQLSNFGEDSLAAWGFAGYDPQSSRLAISIQTAFNHHKLTLTCSGDSEPLRTRKERIKSQDGVVFEYWIWDRRPRIKVCLRKPIKMMVDGRTFRLDTSLLRQAADNAIDRAEED